MPDAIAYDELRLRIRPGSRGKYLAAATADDDSHGEAMFVNPFSDDDLNDFVGKVDPTRVRGRSIEDLVQEAEKFGTSLGNALFVGDVRDVYRSARERAKANGRGLRISLGLTAAPELMEVPWEFLHYQRGFMAQSVQTPIVRALDTTEVRLPNAVVGPLRILVIASQPTGLRPLDVEREKERLSTALSVLVADKRVIVDWLEPPTLGALEERIAMTDDVHVLHFIGHGAYEEQREGGIIAFEDARGRRRDVSGAELCGILRDELALRLVILNACEGARSSHVDPFSGVAASLLECGISAVVAMQFSVSDPAATLFAGRFYRLIADGYPIDAAVSRTRVALQANDFGVEFATPVLFLRGAETVLFRLPTVSMQPFGTTETASAAEDPARSSSAASFAAASETTEGATAPPSRSAGADSVEAGDSPGPAYEPAVARRSSENWTLEITGATLTQWVCRFHTTYGTYVISLGGILGGDTIRLDGTTVGRLTVDAPLRFDLVTGPETHKIEIFRSLGNWYTRFWIDVKVDGEYVVVRDKLVPPSQ